MVILLRKDCSDLKFRLLSSALALCMLVTSTLPILPSHVFAEEVAGAGEQNVIVSAEGTTTPATLSVTVPTAVSFTITPDNENPVVTVPFDISNSSNFGVKVEFFGASAKAGTSVPVVGSSKYADWNALTASETLGGIALGLTFDSQTLWSTSEADGQPTSPLGFANIEKAGSKEFDLGVKSGLAWADPQNLQYDLNLRVGISDESNPSKQVGLRVNREPTKTDYHVGETFNPANLLLEGVCLDGTTFPVTEYTVSPNRPFQAEDTAVTFTKDGFSATLPITIVSTIGILVNTEPNKTTYFVNEEFDPSGMVISEVFSDGSTRVLGKSEYNYTVNNMGGFLMVSITGNTPSTVLFTTDGWFDIWTMLDITATFIGKKTYGVGKRFNDDGLTVQASYENSTDHTTRNTADYTITPDRPLIATDKEVVVHVDTFTYSIPITVETATMTGWVTKDDSNLGVTRIVGYNGTDRSVVVPAVLNGKPTMLSATHFYDDYNTTLDIFADRKNIDSITFEKGVKGGVSLSSLFKDCSATSIDITNLDISGAEGMAYMFKGVNLETLDLSAWKNVANTDALYCWGIFANATIKSLDSSMWNVAMEFAGHQAFLDSNITNLKLYSSSYAGVSSYAVDYETFIGCTSDVIDMRTWTVAQLKSDPAIFENSPNVKKIIVKDQAVKDFLSPKAHANIVFEIAK